jgi:hypothetical protein
VVAACGAPAKPPPAPPVPVENITRTCTEAAVGIEGATKSIRSPESESLVNPMRALCNTDHWSGDAIECFATMHEDDLGRCAGKLGDEPRKAMFSALGDNDEAAIAIARIRLDGMHVGVAECDQLFATVRQMLVCERIPTANRAQLGKSAADLWDLPKNIPPDAKAKMAAVCKRTLDEMRRLETEAACTP